MKGEKNAKNMERLRNIASKLTGLLIKEGWIFTEGKTQEISKNMNVLLGLVEFQLVCE